MCELTRSDRPEKMVKMTVVISTRTSQKCEYANRNSITVYKRIIDFIDFTYGTGTYWQI